MEEHCTAFRETMNFRNQEVHFRVPACTAWSVPCEVWSEIWVVNVTPDSRSLGIQFRWLGWNSATAIRGSKPQNDQRVNSFNINLQSKTLIIQVSNLKTTSSTFITLTDENKIKEKPRLKVLRKILPPPLYSYYCTS